MKKRTKRIIGAALAAAVTLSCVPSVPATGIFSAPFVYSTEAAGTISMTAAGWKESAWAEWTQSDTTGAAGYVVSYKKDGASSFTTIDDALIRRYSDGHWRADIPGLSAGSYTLKVDAVDSSNSSKASATAAVTVVSYDRTGYAFSPSSKFDSTNACGAYKADGTPKAGAEIIYIKSSSDIDTVTCDGVTGLSNILQARDKRTSAPLIVRIIGKIDYSGGQLNGSGYIQVKPSSKYKESNITIEGIGRDTTINFGFLLRNAGNVEIRNLAIHDFKDDGISLDTANTDIWIHNNEIFYGVQGSGDKAKGDGATDVKNDSQYVTISYNHYWDGGKCSLCGMKGESGDNFITYHHNWFDHSDSRHPRIRTMSVHVFNNYYDGNAKYGVGASEGSSAFVENNYFRNCKYPTLQGSVGCDSDGEGGSTTLEDSNPIGAVKTWNNKLVTPNANWKQDAPGAKEGKGDACLAESRTQVISYTTEAGAVYNNFDTSDSYVKGLSPETPDAAKANVEMYAGRVGGGDFKTATGFAFDDSVDDTSYAINTTLRTALTNYCANKVSSEYVISAIGGKLDDSFKPVEPETQTSAETPTETTTAVTETPSETTTAAQASVVTEKFNEGYSFAGSGMLTQDSSYGGAYYTISGISATNGENYVKYQGGSALVYDTDDGSQTSNSSDGITTNFILPIGMHTDGTVTIEGEFRPSKSAAKWTFMQIWGSGAETLGVRTQATTKYYGLRCPGVNGNEPVEVCSTAMTTDKTSFKLVIDLDNKKAQLTVGGKTSNEMSFTGDSIDTIKFVTASDSRNITVYPIKVTSTGGTGAVKGDINLDGAVNSADVSLALSYLAGGASLSSDRIAAGDFNDDGKITLFDAFYIKKAANG